MIPRSREMRSGNKTCPRGLIYIWMSKKLSREFKYPDEVNMRGYKPEVKVNLQQIKKVVAALDKAKKPLICAGGGVILGDGEEHIRAFCEKFNIPVVSTMMGIGVMPKKHPLYFGMLGNNGKPYANKAVGRSDLLIIVGARLADRAIPKPENLVRRVGVIHIDIDTAEIGKNMGPTIPLVGDVKDIFQVLMEQEIPVADQSWIDELEEVKHSTVDPRVFSDKLVNPNLLVQMLSEKMDDNAVYVADVGQNQLWSADNYVMKNGRFRLMLTKLYGRRSDLLYDTKGRPVTPYVITNNFWDVEGVRQYRFLQTGRKTYELRLNGDRSRMNAEDMLRRIRPALGEDADITVTYVDEIPVLASGKRKYIENLCPELIHEKN